MNTTPSPWSLCLLSERASDSIQVAETQGSIWGRVWVRGWEALQKAKHAEMKPGTVVTVFQREGRQS